VAAAEGALEALAEEALAAAAQVVVGNLGKSWEPRGKSSNNRINL